MFTVDSIVTKSVDYSQTKKYEESKLKSAWRLCGGPTKMSILEDYSK